MRKKILVFCSLIMSSGIFAQNQTEPFYYYQGEKIYLKENKEKILIKLSSKAKESEIKLVIKETHYKLTNPEANFSKLMVLESSKEISNHEREKNLRTFKSQDNVKVANFMLKTKKGDHNVGLTDEMIVKLLPSTTKAQFIELVNKFKCEIVRRDKYNSNLFIIRTTKFSQKSTIDVSVILYETLLFEYSEPNFIQTAILHSVDPLYNDQWALNNTGQGGGTAGVDIQIEEAWEITQGRSDIRIAVIDEGIHLTHPDLVGNLVTGHDASGNNTNGGPVPTSIGHGTLCAGIAGATANNNMGIAGVANECSIIPISLDISTAAIFDPIKAGDAINWAWDQGNADVLSNSWGTGLPSSYLNNAINNAVTLGRDGLGCVVLFAAGNENESSLVYPANLPTTIGIGGTDMCDKRVLHSGLCDGGNSGGGSNYGPTLDLVAPGYKIKTTQNSSGYADFTGTSAATPMVAGIAGLILSVNPCLTHTEVKEILELSCDKPVFVSNVTNSAICYSNQLNRPNGTWHNEMGHGRVNAFKAVQYAASENIITVNNVSGNSGGPTANMFPWVLFNGSYCSGDNADTYFVHRYEITKNIYYPYRESPQILASSNGFSVSSPNGGAFWAQAFNVTNTNATLRTFVYNVVNSSGNSIGWIPNLPSDVRFSYSVVENVDASNIFLQNDVVSAGIEDHRAINEILVGSNVTSTIPQGNYVAQGASTIDLKAGNQIRFETGTDISPLSGYSFHAVVEPLFTCIQYPTGISVQPSSSATQYEGDETFIKDYTVSYEEQDFLNKKTKLMIYPNPAINKTTIEYFLPISSEVVISIFDLEGREIVNLKNRKVHDAGNYKVVFELNDFSSGTYTITLTTNEGVYSHTLIKQ